LNHSQAHATRRRQLGEIRKQEAARPQQTADRQARADIMSLIAVLDRRIAKVEAQIGDLIKADPELRPLKQRLQTAPGVGPIVAATLIAELPELGQLIAAASLPSRAWHRSRATAASVSAHATSAAVGQSSERSFTSQLCRPAGGMSYPETFASAFSRPGNRPRRH
jgi:transposase